MASTTKSIVLTAEIVLVAITLFLMGPQLGSIDADGDGCPEVPIIVLLERGSDAYFLHALKSDQRTSVVAVVVSLFAALPPDDLEHIRRELVSHQRGSTLRPFGLLRC